MASEAPGYMPSIISYLLSDSPYAPPKNSVDYTTIINTNDEKMRLDLIPKGLVAEGHKGKILILEVYGYTCPHCISAIPELNSLKARYPDDVYLVTVESYGLSSEALKQYVRDKGLEYDTVAKENSGKVLSWVPSLIGHPIYGVPTLLVFGRDGILVENYLGPDFDIVDDLIRSLL